MYKMATNGSTLLLVTVLFRHGNRTPDTNHIPPINPFKNYSFFPYKYDELTHEGQKRMINVGRDLRKRYDTFLGEIFYTDMVNSTTSSYIRCQMSLQCLHAGLFPPDDIQRGLLNLPWQAIPYKAIPFAEDKFISIHVPCPNVVCNIDPDEVPDHDQELLEFIRSNCGYSRTEYILALKCYDFFRCCSEQGLALPEWVTAIWQDLERLSLAFWKHFFTKRKAFAGPLIRRITDEAVKKIAEEETKKHGIKMYLYAVHDMNLHLVRGALGIWEDKLVNYGAHLIFELHRIEDEYGFKIFFNNDNVKPRPVRIPGYGEFINIDDFVAATCHLYDPEVTCACLDVENKKQTAR